MPHTPKLARQLLGAGIASDYRTMSGDTGSTYLNGTAPVLVYQ